MPGAHRQDDARYCGATTIVEGQSTVFVNSKLWAVDFDPDTHGAGNLMPIVGHTVFCEGKEVIVFGDTCYNCDLAGHCPPDDDPFEHSDDVFAYGS